MIVVVDYGVGNIASILSVLKRVVAKAKEYYSRSNIGQLGELLLPGRALLMVEFKDREVAV